MQCCRTKDGASSQDRSQDLGTGFEPLGLWLGLSLRLALQNTYIIKYFGLHNVEVGEGKHTSVLCSFNLVKKFIYNDGKKIAVIKDGSCSLILRKLFTYITHKSFQGYVFHSQSEVLCHCVSFHLGLRTLKLKKK